MCCKGNATRHRRHGSQARREDEAGDENILVACAPALGRDDGFVIFGRDLVDDAYEAFMPAVFAVFIVRRRSVLLVCEGGWGERREWRGLSIAGICETGFLIGKPGQIEG